LLFTSPSTALAAASPGGFSALAVTPVTPEVMSPGMLVVGGPVTPAALGAPSGLTSTVFVQSSGRWPASKELKNAGAGSLGAACAKGTRASAGVARATARTARPA